MTIASYFHAREHNTQLEFQNKIQLHTLYDSQVH